jgi:hypothetical protein
LPADFDASERWTAHLTILKVGLDRAKVVIDGAHT